jgi:hypothetical protein
MKIFSTPEFWYFLISLIAGFVIYYMSKNVKDEKTNLLVLFKSNQKISSEIQIKLKNFIIEYNANDEIVFPERNLSYGTWYELIIAEYNRNLSDELYESIRIQKLTKPNIETMTDSLIRQNEALRHMDIDMEVVIKRAKNKNYR